MAEGRVRDMEHVQQLQEGQAIKELRSLLETREKELVARYGRKRDVCVRACVCVRARARVRVVMICMCVVWMDRDPLLTKRDVL